MLVGAGDIASCDDLAGAEATAKLIDKIPGKVFAVGDLAYPDGSDDQFAKCYAPTWGRFRDRTRPAPGNHEYHKGVASGYARYFGDAADDPNRGLLQLRTRRVAHRGAEPRVRRSGRLRGGITARTEAEAGSRAASGDLHAGSLSPAPMAILSLALC